MMCPTMWAYWHHLANTTEQSVCGSDAVLCQITLSTCLFMLPMFVVQSSSGMLTIGRIAYRGEGWQECTARANCNLRLPCCFYYVISMIKAAEHFSNPFHMFVEMVSSLYDTKMLENFCMVLKSSILFPCVCPVEAPLKLNCREMSIMEMSWFICHRLIFCEVSVGLAAIKPAWNSFPRNVSHGNSPQNFHRFLSVWSPMKWSSIMRACTIENPWRLCHQ